MKIISYIFFLSLLILFGPRSYTQITFEEIIFGPRENYGIDVVQTHDSGYIICGSQGCYYYQWPAWDLSLTKTDKFGGVQWVKYYGPSIDNHGRSVQETSDEGFIACGVSQFDGYIHAFLVKTDPYGDTLFTKTYLYNGFDTYSYSIQQCYDQGFVLCGMVLATDSVFTVVIKTDVNGDIQWEKGYYSGFNEVGKSILCMPDSGFTIISSSSGTSTLMRRLDKNGTVAWEKTYANIEGMDFQNTKDGGYIICGQEYLGSNQHEIRLLKTDNFGDSIWFKSIQYNAYANSITVTSDDGYIIGGTIKDSSSQGVKHLFLLHLDQGGELIWTRKFGGSDIDMGTAVKATFDQGYIFTGTTKESSTDSIAVILIKGIDDSTTTRSHNEPLAKKLIMVYPNPTNGILKLKFTTPQRNIKIEISDLNGTRCFEDFYSNVNNLIQILLPSLRTGVFLIKIQTADYIFNDKILYISPE